MEIGPIVDSSLQTRDGLRRREYHTQHLISRLLDSSLLHSSEVNSKRFLYRRYKKLVRDAVIASLATLFECQHNEILSNAAAPELMAMAIQEAWEVVRRDLPGTKPNIVKAWVEQDLTDKVHSMTHHVRIGEDTGIEKISGWLIERARQWGFECPTHQALMGWVIAKTMENRKRLYFIETQKHHDQQVSSRSEAGRLDEALPCE
ncbi:hypothetical protein BDZ45DRAFT_243722 [Acephala macrosclerotiorum]|nr:hypothetical protein BDZ45DRAFT_243722 [Acephala macrosclerotiorum]